MAYCTVHSIGLLVTLLRRWMGGGRGQYQQQLHLSIVAACWMFCASSLFTACSIFNVIRLFKNSYEALFFNHLVPSFFTLGGIFVAAAATIVSLFWGENALRHRGGGKVGLTFRIFKNYSLLSSFIVIGFYIGSNAVNGPGPISGLLLVVGQCMCGQMFLVCCVGTYLVRRELKSLKEQLPSVRRALKNIQAAGFKILFLEASMTISSVAYGIAEGKLVGAVPGFVSHLFLIILYFSIGALILSIGEYLAFTKVKTLPFLLFIAQKFRECLTAAWHIRDDRRVYIVNISSHYFTKHTTTRHMAKVHPHQSSA
uniref:Uncharacterized protein n=1 Tax=Heterosigma akashiwo TaxID=2829 RepID=A0A7S3UPD4_HETAK